MEAGRGEPFRSCGEGRVPEGVLLSYPLGDDQWDRASQGVGDALATYAMHLLGGDTVSLPARALRVLSPDRDRRGTARPSRDRREGRDSTGDRHDRRRGCRTEDAAGAAPPTAVIAAPTPRPMAEAGERLAPLVHAMMDVSDGLLIDA